MWPCSVPCTLCFFPLTLDRVGGERKEAGRCKNLLICLRSRKKKKQKTQHTSRDVGEKAGARIVTENEDRKLFKERTVILSCDKYHIK